MHYGFSAEHSTESTDTLEYTLNMEMDEKIDYILASEEFKISETYRAEISVDTKDTYSYDFDTTVTLQCTE